MLKLRLDARSLLRRIWVNDDYRIKEDSSKRLTLITRPGGDVLMAISRAWPGELTGANCSKACAASQERKSLSLVPVCWGCRYVQHKDRSEKVLRKLRYGLSFGECIRTLVEAQDVALIMQTLTSKDALRSWDRQGDQGILKVEAGHFSSDWAVITIGTSSLVETIVLSTEPTRSLTRFLAVAGLTK